MLLWLASLTCGLVLRRGVELVQWALTAPVRAHAAARALAALPALATVVVHAAAILPDELRVGPLLPLRLLHLLERHR